MRSAEHNLRMKGASVVTRYKTGEPASSTTLGQFGIGSGSQAAATRARGIVLDSLRRTEGSSAECLDPASDGPAQPPERMGHRAARPCGFPPAGRNGIPSPQVPAGMRARKRRGGSSHGNETRVEVLFRNWQVVGFEGTDVGLDSFPNIPKRRFLGFALGHAAGQTGALGDHQAVFPAIEQDLSHVLIVSDFGTKSEVPVSKQRSGKPLSLSRAKRATQRSICPRGFRRPQPLELGGESL